MNDIFVGVVKLWIFLLMFILSGASFICLVACIYAVLKGFVEGYKANRGKK